MTKALQNTVILTLADLQGARAGEIPDCSSYSLRIPWIATAVGCQPTHARLLPS